MNADAQTLAEAIEAAGGTITKTTITTTNENRASVTNTEISTSGIGIAEIMEAMVVTDFFISTVTPKAVFGASSAGNAAITVTIA